ncbi:ABC transporter substrate-binding protein [Streptomyces sp. 6N223]|uniref:ABC transporter substrate-binding protein n=1 Tax=Streptomyces sp. 6N223 TaxID=3457412 RepID=UPI003FD4C5CF
MDLSRRRFVQTALLATAGTPLMAACGGGSGGSGTTDGKELTLWYWGGGLSDSVVDDAKRRFARREDIELSSSLIGGNFRQKLLTSMNARSNVPDITGIKGEDIAALLPNADRFIDLNTLGFDRLRSDYLEWKWKQGQSQDGVQVGFPIDIGPTALFYRHDLLADAGLPAEPDEVAAATATWDDYFALGQEFTRAVPGAFWVRNTGTVFSMAMGQGSSRLIDENNTFIGDQDHVRAAWDLAVRPYELGIDAKINDESLAAALAAGDLVTETGAAWAALDIASMAPDTEGNWRVAPLPGGPSNLGGSFLALPRECRNPEAAFDIITWLLSPENQARGFEEAALFPSAPAAYDLPALTAPDPFFGGQKTVEVFGPAAEGIPAFYEAPADAAVSVPYYTELTTVEVQGKDPEDAWEDAVDAARQIARQEGVG